MRFSAAMTVARFLPPALAGRVGARLAAAKELLLGAGEVSRAARMSLIAFATRIVSAVIAFAGQILLARWMGGYEYGIYVFVWTAVLIAGNLSCFGFHTSVIRFVPEYAGSGEWARLRGVLLASRLFVLAASTLLAIAGAAAILGFGGRIDAHYLAPLLLGTVCLPMIALSDLMQGFARGHAWPFLSMLPTYILRPLLIIGAMLAALAAGREANAETAMLAAIAATYATTLVQLVAVSNRAERAAPEGPRSYPFRGWLAVSLPVFLVEGFFYLLTNADVLMVGFFLAPTDVAVYFATVKTLALVHFVYFAVKAGAAQRFASYAHGGRSAELASLARDTVRWTFWPSLALGLVVLLAGKQLLGLFGAGFQTGHVLLPVLVAGVVARAAVGPAESLLTMSGHQRLCARIYGFVLVLNIALNVLLIARLGLWGAAVATATAMAVEALLLGIAVRRQLGIRMWIGAGPDTIRSDERNAAQ